MSDLLLAQPNLPSDFIDTSVGEANLVRSNLISTFNLSGELSLGKLKINDLVYPTPIGYSPLVKFLENKYHAPVIITNGAKQGLGAAFYSLKKMGWNYCGEKSPHWALIPSLAKMHGIDMIHANGPHVDDRSPFLLLSPNNPDGHCESSNELISLSEEFKNHNLPLIHDCAYYAHSYLSGTHSLPAIGDVQIYSFSKMFGLSGCRLGFVVCHNPIFYKLIQEYMEAMTVGVSINSQAFLYEIIQQVYADSNLLHKFEFNNFMGLKRNKEICLQLDPKVLEVPPDFADTPGMFAFLKVGPKANFNRAKINIIEGTHFGAPGMIRINLSFDENKMQEIVNKLNASKDE